MHEKTVRALAAVNRRFYREAAEAFSATREAPWPGWRRLLSWIEDLLAEPGGLRVLDLGCGNGRFGAFLSESLAERNAAIHYTGVDASPELLERARRALEARALASCALRAGDLVEPDPGETLPPGPFSLVVLFGMLHHVPGRERRRALLAAAADRLAPGGLLALTTWQFAASERFRRRMVTWSEYNRVAAEPIDPATLEHGDHLLPWGESGDARLVRYVHHVDEEELDALTRGLPLERVADFRDDGRQGDLNRYCVYRASPEPRQALPAARERSAAARVLEPVRRRIAGAEAIQEALARRRASGPAPAIRCLVVPREGPAPASVGRLLERAAAEGIPIERVGARKFERLRGPDRDAAVLALFGPSPRAEPAEVMTRGGAVWLLSGPVYPGNVGFAIRAAEVSGADGVFVDAAFDHSGRREAVRAAMRADRFLPIGWQATHAVLDAARAAGKRLIAIEDVGEAAPWEVNLTGSVLLIVGGEADGVPGDALARCDAVVRIPMLGFVASYNLQAAVAAVAAERLRQMTAR